MDIILILLAAGDSRRFNGNKLLHDLNGKPMYRYIADELEKLPEDLFAQKIVVTQYPEIMEDLGARGYLVVENRESSLGISHSIELALKAAAGENRAYCFVVCDQPYLKAQTIRRLIEGYQAAGRGIGCLASRGEPGNPVVFTDRYRTELLELSGDVGGRRVLRRHMDDLYFCEVDDRIELADMDVNTDSID